jgi:hypothetical protein
MCYQPRFCQVIAPMPCNASLYLTLLQIKGRIIGVANPLSPYELLYSFLAVVVTFHNFLPTLHNIYGSKSIGRLFCCYSSESLTVLVIRFPYLFSTMKLKVEYLLSFFYWFCCAIRHVECKFKCKRKCKGLDSYTPL